jgi:hypothetical protein
LTLILAACGGGEAKTAESTDGALTTSSSSDASTATAEATEAMVPTTAADSEASSTGEPGQTCEPQPLVAPGKGFFADISDASGIRVENFVPDPPMPIPINDHSRLGFVDLDGDGFDDIVAHSLFPNPKAGIPFEHLVYRNNGDGTFSHFSDESGLRAVQAGFFAFGDVDNDGDQDCFAGLDIELPGEHNRLLLNDGAGHFTEKADAGVDAVNLAGNAVFADFNGDANLDLFVGNGQTSYAVADQLFFGFGDGTSRTSPASSCRAARPQPSNGSVACDYDDDGDLDVFVSTYGVSTYEGPQPPVGERRRRHHHRGRRRPRLRQPADRQLLARHHRQGPGPRARRGPRRVRRLQRLRHPVRGRDRRRPPRHLPHHHLAPRRRRLQPQVVRPQPAADQRRPRRRLRLHQRVPRPRPPVQRGRRRRRHGRLRQRRPHRPVRLARQASTSPLRRPSTSRAGSACCIRSPTAASPASAPTAASTTREADYLQMKAAQNHAWSDIDHDGDLDLLVGGRDTGGGRPNFLFENTLGSNNAWLALRLVGDGVKINRDAIGARVSVVFADWKVTREVKAGRGSYNSLDSRTLHFGLGDLGCDYTLELRWPDGTTQSLTPAEIGVNRYLTLEYPG